MLLIPAIDLKDGRCVRLRQGNMDADVSVFSEDPVAMARHWRDQGARRLHIVDLNGARSGRPVNEPVIKKIVKAVGEELPVEASLTRRLRARMASLRLCPSACLRR